MIKRVTVGHLVDKRSLCPAVYSPGIEEDIIQDVIRPRLDHFLIHRMKRGNDRILIINGPALRQCFVTVFQKTFPVRVRAGKGKRFVDHICTGIRGIVKISPVHIDSRVIGLAVLRTGAVDTLIIVPRVRRSDLKTSFIIRNRIRIFIQHKF